MIELENQHWVPKFVLKNFVDSDGRVFRFDVASNEVSKPPPKYAASKPNYYELLVRGDPQSFEERFERVESAAAPAIAEIIKKRSLSSLGAKQRAAVAVFVAAQSFRTEGYRIGLGLGQSRQDIGSTLDMLFADLGALANLIDRRKWALLVTTETMPFYLGDNPVVLQNTEHPGRAGEIGLDMAGIEAFMPLSPDCALYMPCPLVGQEIMKGYWNGLRIVAASLAEIDLIDYDVPTALPLGKKALASAAPLYQAFVHGEPLLAEPENVENLNYLQCAWASSAIYSNRNDFSFAMRVFRENPQYRATMPVSLRRVRGWH